jgi:hypothetical protein
MEDYMRFIALLLKEIFKAIPYHSISYFETPGPGPQRPLCEVIHLTFNFNIHITMGLYGATVAVIVW